MEKFSKEMLRKLANQVMFDLNDQECEELQEEFETYLKQLDLLNKIDTENVEEINSIENMPSILSIINQEKCFKEDVNNINNGYPILNWQ